MGIVVLIQMKYNINIQLIAIHYILIFIGPIHQTQMVLLGCISDVRFSTSGDAHFTFNICGRGYFTKLYITYIYYIFSATPFSICILTKYQKYSSISIWFNFCAKYINNVHNFSTIDQNISTVCQNYITWPFYHLISTKLIRFLQRPNENNIWPK